MKSANV
jgi:hypothetical protein